jgi:hypothetical protein
VADMKKIALNFPENERDRLAGLDIPNHTGKGWWLLEPKMQSLCCLGTI